MSSTFHVGWAWRVSAATPATCGDDIDVPESPAPALPVPMAVEMMLTPGAVTSGLRPLSPGRGPPEVKLANPVKVGVVSGAAATDVAGPSATARSFPPSDARFTGAADPLTPRNGIVTLKASPVSGFEEIGRAHV